MTTLAHATMKWSSCVCNANDRNRLLLYLRPEEPGSQDSLTTQTLVTMDCRALVFASESCRHRLEPLQRTMQSKSPRNSLAQAFLGVITAVGILQTFSCCGCEGKESLKIRDEPNHGGLAIRSLGLSGYINIKACGIRFDVLALDRESITTAKSFTLAQNAKVSESPCPRTCLVSCECKMRCGRRRLQCVGL